MSNDYEAKISTLNNQLASVKLREPANCIMPTARTTTRNNGSTSPSINAKQNGVTFDALYDYAAEAEKYRLQLIGCQSFITQTWAETK